VTGDQTASLIYLLVIGTVIALSHLVANRRNLSRVARQAALWGLIFLGTIAAVGLWPTIRDTVVPRQAVLQDGRQITVPMSADGHFYLTLDLNGVPVRFVVDTGATEIVLSAQDAARIGLDPASLNYSGRAMTANGMVETAPVRLETVALGPVVDQGVRAVVNRGELAESLLGMSYLRRFQRLEIAGGQLLLER
jgi:aspartyl protease family protein